MTRRIDSSHAPGMEHFLETYLYRKEAFLLDDVLRLDAEHRVVEARMNTSKLLPLAQYQRVHDGYPAHVTAAELIMVTASLGSLHAWFFYGCRWDDGWVGFGNRIHRADFKALARIGPPLELRSCESRARVGSRRIMIRFDFEFSQGDKAVYHGDQSALFLKGGVPS